MRLPRAQCAIAVAIAVTGCRRTPSEAPPPPDAAPTCDEATHAQRAKELTAIASADQADRTATGMAPGTREHDRQRRERVRAIDAEGCIKDAQDLSAAWLVFQHGELVAEHRAAFDYAQRALAMQDDATMRNHVALAADRWLLSQGRKPLFGTQAGREGEGGLCACLISVQPDFPEATRLHYTGKSLADQRAWVAGLNAGAGEAACPKTDCVRQLADTPKGSVEGIW